ncbi:MAG TPA: CxxC-x17-CxxC domain-containing protein [Candidatus Udaeobacter sp.]|nr:CxxC-x17-CxxC domain-containing protein [Candidatus Udaeobacter sp.]
MKNFHRGDKSGGGRDHKGFGKRNSGGHGFGGGNRGFGGRDGERPNMMFKAVCSQCGKDCQLPFKPNGNRPVFCSTCFEIQKNENPDRSERKSFSKPKFEDKKLFEAVCGNCGDNCLVPFRPFPGKPVFCKKCFDKDDKVVNHTIVKTDNSNNKNFEQLKSEIEMINIKLDRILRELTPKEDREEIEEEVEEIVKEAPKKTAKPSKKSTAKKKK